MAPARMQFLGRTESPILESQILMTDYCILGSDNVLQSKLTSHGLYNRTIVLIQRYEAEIVCIAEIGPAKQ